MLEVVADWPPISNGVVDSVVTGEVIASVVILEVVVFVVFTVVSLAVVVFSVDVFIVVDLVVGPAEFVVGASIIFILMKTSGLI